MGELTMTKPKAVADATISMWKKQYGEVFCLTVKAEGEDKPELTGYFRKPNIEILSAASSAPNPVHQGNILFENCWLGGDEAVSTDDEARMGAIAQLAQLFKPRVASLKKV